MLPSVFVKATSRVLPPCFFLFPFAGPKLQRSALGKKTRFAYTWRSQLSVGINVKVHTGTTRLKHSGNQAALLTDISQAQLDFEQERLQAHSLKPLCCLITAAHCMCYQCFSLPHFSFLQVKLEKSSNEIFTIQLLEFEGECLFVPYLQVKHLSVG